MTATVQVEIPTPLSELAVAPREFVLEVVPPVTVRAILDALEVRYPMLTGTIRDHRTGQRRAYLRFFASGQDLSHLHPEELLPPAVAEGREPFLIVGAIAGG